MRRPCLSYRSAVTPLILVTILSSSPAFPKHCHAAPAAFAKAVEDVEAFVGNYCLDCHNEADAVQDVDLESVELSAINWRKSSEAQSMWELSYKRIASRQMPPPDATRPSDDEFKSVTAALAVVLDQAARQSRNITPVDTLRRLTRTEYQNSVRDLLNLDIDASQWIPKDESSQGFDNITVGELSPALMSRYLTAAEKISRLAIGRRTGIPTGINVRLPADLTQEKHIDGLPLGTRGGTSIRHTFAESGVYEIAVRLTRDRDEMVEGLNREHDMDVLVDRDRKHRFRIKPPADGKDYTHIDTNLKVRLPIDAGPHDIAVTFPSQGDSLLAIKRQPFDAAYNRHRHPRQQPAVFEVAIVGPLETDANPTSTKRVRTPSRQHILTVEPKSDHINDLTVAAKTILQPILRRAYRRQINDEDLASPLKFFTDALQTSLTTDQKASIDSSADLQDRFETGIERSVASILVNPNFLFRIEQAPSQPNAQRISDTELASRLSYFVWSSLPDDELLSLAFANRLHHPKTLRRQVRRMLADKRSQSLVDNFASQWLYLRNLDSISPDLRSFPDYDENLRTAFRDETKHLFQHVMQNDASVLGLLVSDFTFLNERLANHYGIPGVVGSQFRRVALPADSHRGGILRHGSILSVTSYATRTSPTIRGNWVLENVVGTPPPPPPPNVPTLKEKSTLVASTFRELLAQHRENESCASCHALIDPVGFALDNFDAIGRWRTYNGDERIDASGVLPDGTPVASVDDLEASLMGNPDLFVSCMTEKMMTFALGRGVDYRDAAAVRSVVRRAQQKDYQFSSLVEGIVASEPFQFRTRDQE